MDPADEYHTPFGFVGNNPIRNADSDGRRTWTVNGTTQFFGSDPSLHFPPTVTQAWGSVFGDKNATQFIWTGDYNYWEWQQAANSLALEIRVEKCIHPDEPINIAAWSMGSPVAILAANIAFAHGIKVDNLITIAAPAIEGYSLRPGAVDNLFVNLYNHHDLVQVLGGLPRLGFAGRDQIGALNLDISTLFAGTTASRFGGWHSIMHQNPKVQGLIRSMLQYETITIAPSL
ncbi:MAG: hypothetical protein HY961_18840 [Ignavibacteriae bacterium]|nr:hypothetical protein [Ignavibacteriota bacterium]